MPVINFISDFMEKKYLKIFSIVLGVLFLMLLFGNFGLNFWLKNNLPNYVKNNSDYLISYKTMDVHLGTGNIVATGISINNKNPQNSKVLGLQGTVDSLNISRLEIYDAIFNKKFSTSSLILKNPHLDIILPKPRDKKDNLAKKPLVMDLLKINSGNISIFRHTKQKFLSVKDLNLEVEDLRMTEETAGGKLPLTFEKYVINGKDLFFRPDNVYAFTAKHITTKEAQIKLQNFALIPLLSYQNFTRFYPKKRNLFDFKTSEIEFKDIVLKDNKITLTRFHVKNPVLKMYTTNSKPAEKEKSFTYDVHLEDLIAENAKIEILNPNGSPLFSAENLSLKVNQFLMNEESAKGNIPFQYNDFKINGNGIRYFSDTQNINVAQLSINPKFGDLQNISVKPTVVLPQKASLDLTAKQLQLKINEWKFINNKLSLNIQNVLVDAVKGKITSAKIPQKKQVSFGGIHYPLTIKNVVLKNSDLVLDRKNQPMTFNNLNATIQNVEMNEKTVKNSIPFQTGFYSLTSSNFNYKTKFYHLSSSSLQLSKNSLQVLNFAMKPTVSRAQFIRMIPAEKDLYDLKVQQINMQGNWDLFSDNRYVNVSQVVLNQMDANIFRSKIPKDDPTEKPMYSKLLRSIKFPLNVNDLRIKNSLLVYEEDTKKSDGPGKIVFTDFNLSAKNLNSGKMRGKPGRIPIEIHCKFMNASPMKVTWNIDTASESDAFLISGNIADLPASRINPFAEPYLKIRATGTISELSFDFKGNKAGLNGTLNMKHQDLKVAILKSTGEKDGILSAVANLVVRTNSGSYPESVSVENVERDATKSFFNLLWRGIEQGLKKTLIGVNAPKTEEKIKATVENTKSALEGNKKDLQETKQDVKEKVEQTKKKINEKGFFEKIFKKKSEN